MTKLDHQEFAPYLDEREQQIADDYEWCLNNQEIRQKYRGKVVVVYRRQVLGVGKDHVTAWSAARRKRSCPEKGYAAVVVVP